MYHSALTVSMEFFFFQAEDGIRDPLVTGVQTCALPIWPPRRCRSPRLVRLEAVARRIGQVRRGGERVAAVRRRRRTGLFARIARHVVRVLEGRPDPGVESDRKSVV